MACMRDSLRLPQLEAHRAGLKQTCHIAFVYAKKQPRILLILAVTCQPSRGILLTQTGQQTKELMPIRMISDAEDVEQKYLSK